MRVTSRIGVFVATLAIFVVGVVAIPSPATAATKTLPIMANVGDSFASGEGGIETGPYAAGSDTVTNQCHRSATSPGRLVALVRGVTLNDVACSGATTADITMTTRYGEPPQASRLSPHTRSVLVMVGGNDVGFGTLVGCFIQLDCEQTPVPQSTLALIQQLGPKLDAAYNVIRAKVTSLGSILAGSG